ncbi:hypothetical protein GGI04_005856 [Coemansia thaxteri]|nr:hypothetical protein GGI04_005856 [Coemansia thaxteri]KAJ2488111.1 hypothetical protein EV174_000070 [Coemansia sp. RSA 2320]
MSRIHSRRWAELDNDVRATYFEQSRIDKEEYSQKMAFYEQTLEHKHYEEYLEQFYKQESTGHAVI